MKISFKQRILLTLLLLIIARLGVFIPVPGIDHDAFFKTSKNNQFVNFLNIFSGGGFSTIGIFALGIVPYINSSIIMQIFIKINPYLEKLQQEEGELGRQQINQYTRWLAFVWSIIQSVSVAFWIRPYVFNWNLIFVLDTVTSLVVGSLIVMWISELITENGIGNGTSLLIFFNVISNFPKGMVNKFFLDYSFNFDLIMKLSLAILTFLFMLILTIFMQEVFKKIKIVSAKQLSESQTNVSAGKLDNYIPLKLYQGGVMPIILASAAISLPIYIGQMVNNDNIRKILFFFTPSSFSYFVLYCILIVTFSYVYASLIFNPNDIAKNLRRTGSSIIGVRPGPETITYLKTILNRLTFLGSIFLFIIAILPSFMSMLHIDFIKTISPTSILILVGVAIQTAKQVQAYIMSDQYDEIAKKDI
uniref:preprotein translocase subunit SecY n=1 Tax=Erythrolobus coxiae TaxID=362235 RepID=UPI001FCCD9CD|nr:preprotein translocase subunit SecY [Erythrolobus coxiae]UNJ17628.1 preprotein translocase subunit SecY [Erythrolobus coxiae]